MAANKSDKFENTIEVGEDLCKEGALSKRPHLTPISDNIDGQYDGTLDAACKNDGCAEEDCPPSDTLGQNDSSNVAPGFCANVNQVSASDSQVQHENSDDNEENKRIEEEKRHKLLEKLNELITDNKKFPKAAKVLTKLMETDLRSDTTEDFFPLLQKLHALSPHRQGCDVIKQGCRDIFDLVHSRISLFSDEHTFQLRTMVLIHAISHRLNTDDTYQLATAAKFVQEAILQLDTAFPRESDIAIGMEITTYVPTSEEKSARLKAILVVLKDLFQHRKQQWAKASVDHAFKLAADRRLMFDKETRDQIDDMYDAIKGLRSTSTVNTKRSADPRRLFRSWAT